jgi:hypothetical protein
VPRSRMNASGSKPSPGTGRHGIEHSGSANDPSARETPCQMESRVRGSESIIASSDSAHPVAAWVEPVRIATASAAVVGSRVQRNSSAGGRWSIAAACRSACSAELVLPSQNPPPSTPPEDEAGAGGEAGGADHRGLWVTRSPGSATSASRRAGPRRGVAGRRPRPARCGGGRAWSRSGCRGGSRSRRRPPGASRIAGITRCRPLPERGGPMTMIESSTDAHTLAPLRDAEPVADILRPGTIQAGAQVPGAAQQRLLGRGLATSCRVAMPAMRRGSCSTRCVCRRSRDHTHSPPVTRALSRRLVTIQ